MARGFDSKSVSDQQEERERQRENRQRLGQTPLLSARRRQLELARVDLTKRLETAAGHYRETLQKALDAVDAQLAQDGGGEGG